MKRIVSSLVLCACVASSYASITPKDSLVNALGKTDGSSESTEVHATVYPTFHKITSDEELNNDLKMLRFAKAETTLKKRISTAKRKRESTAEYDRLTEVCRKGDNGLRGIDNVVIVDSVVVSKQDFLRAYPLSDDLGTLTLNPKGDRVSYKTQLNGMMLQPLRLDEGDSTHLQLVKGYLENERFTAEGPITGLGVKGDLNYPFLMPDGQTLYFAARSDEGYGNYDLFVTRFDNASGRFYHADNMGYPYNSYANDYMLVIDENANLGWFASDRYQPSGKVCIYTFIPNESRQTIDYETTQIDTLRHAATLRSLRAIHLTDAQLQAKADAKKRIASLKRSSQTAKAKRDFEFVVNDSKTCYTLADFNSPEAQQLCSDWLQKSKNLVSLYQELQQMRETTPTTRQPILNLESRIQDLQQEVHVLEKKIRAEEIGKN